MQDYETAGHNRYVAQSHRIILFGLRYRFTLQNLFTGTPNIQYYEHTMPTLTKNIAGEVKPNRLRCTICGRTQLTRNEAVTITSDDNTATIYYSCRNCNDDRDRIQHVTRTTDGFDWDFLNIAKVHSVSRSKNTTDRPVFRSGHELEATDPHLTDDEDAAADASNETQVGHAKHDGEVYIGCGNDLTNIITADYPGENGWLGNPFVTEDNGGDYTHEEAVEKYRYVFYQKLQNDSMFRDAVEQLRGKTLGCWCRRVDEDEPACHGDVIAEWLEQDVDRATATTTEMERSDNHDTVAAANRDDAAEGEDGWREDVTDRTEDLEAGDLIVLVADDRDQRPRYIPGKVVAASHRVVQVETPDVVGNDLSPAYVLRSQSTGEMLAGILFDAEVVTIYRRTDA